VKKINKRKVLEKIFATLLFIPSLSLLSKSAKAKTENKVDLIVVWKTQRRMTLFHKKKPLKSYFIRLGFNPKGHKRKEGDGKTPEGSYWITHKNPNSAFHKSLGISYPNKQDKIYAEKNGFSPGKDIFIHGGPRNFLKHFFFDWTEGCIAVTDSEIEEIYNLVNENTPIFITT
jgi:murein L,D-transpeptidase YafK